MKGQQKVGGGDNWDQVHYQIRVSIDNLEAAVQRLENDLRIIGTPRDNRSFRDDITHHLQSTTQSAQEVQRNLTQLIILEKNGSSGFQKSARRQQVKQLSEQVSIAFEKLKRIANEFKVKEERHPLKDNSSSSSSSSSSQNYNVWSRNRDGHYNEDDEQSRLVDHDRREQLRLLEEERRNNEQLIHQRDEGIRDIEKQVSQINDIFRDVQLLVSEQGQQIDDIEANITTADVKVQQGVQELVSANESSRTGNKWICCLAVVIFIICVVVIVIVLFTTGIFG